MKQKINKKSKLLRRLTFKCKITKNHVSYVSEIHTSNTKHTVLVLFNVCCNHAPLNYSGPESKKKLQFVILTYLWPWNKVKVITKPGMNCYTLSKATIMQSLKDSLEQWPQTSQCSSFVNSENTSITSLEYAQKYLLHLLNNPTRFQLNWIRTLNFQLKLLDMLWP